MNRWAYLFMQAFHQHGILIAEQYVSDTNPPLCTNKRNENPSPQLSASTRNKVQNAGPQQGTLRKVTLHNKVSINLTSVQRA
jgi:hypothetical protein